MIAKGIPQELGNGMLLCVQPSCTSMAKTKRVTKGVDKKRVLYDTKKTQVKNISHSALRQKYPSKNNAATPSPGLFSPRPRVHFFIVVLLRLSTGRCGRIRPLGCKLRPLSYPPPPRPKIRQKSHSKNIVASPSPGRSSPRPRVRSLIVV